MPRDDLARAVKASLQMMRRQRAEAPVVHVVLACPHRLDRLARLLRKQHRIDQEVQAAGGYMNAYTSFDRTVYWINVPNTGATTAAIS